MLQRRFAGAGRRHQRHRQPRPQRQLGAVENGQRGFALPVLTMEVVQEHHRRVIVSVLHRRAHSYLKASMGSRRAARPDGNSVARNDSVSAMMTTAAVSPLLISAGSFARKYNSGENSSVLVSKERNWRMFSMFRQM